MVSRILLALKLNFVSDGGLALSISKYYYLALSCLLALMSCQQEVVAPEQQITGLYAWDNDTGLTNKYLEFKNGILSTYTSDMMVPLADNSIWADGGKLFMCRSKSDYFIQDGSLHVGGAVSRIAKEGPTKLVIDNTRYSSVLDFREEPYSVILPESPSYIIPLQGGNYSIPVVIDNPIPAGELKASSIFDWISDLTFENGVISFQAATSKTPRSGIINLEYTYAKDASILVSQSPATFIRLSANPSVSIVYQGTNLEIPYTIDNPVQGSKLVVSSVDSWAQIVSIQSNKVIVSIPANYSGFSRSTTLTFSYTGAEDVSITLNQSSQTITSLTLNKTAISLYTGESSTLQATVAPSNAQPRWKSSRTDVATVTNGLVKAVGSGKAIITVYCGDLSRTCTVIVSSHCPTNAVDLGLTTADGNKLYWAKCNLSESGFVSSPEVFGNHYAWGETATKSSYSWSNYKWCNGSATTLKKYNNDSSYGIVDNKLVLETGPNGDDVASKKLGGYWRIPTKEEWLELKNKCTWTTTTQNGKNGQLVQGPNGNSIFIPAAYRSYSQGIWYVNSYGYWSSTINTTAPSQVMTLCINSDSFSVYNRARYEGYYIRPVSE